MKKLLLLGIASVTLSAQAATRNISFDGIYLGPALKYTASDVNYVSIDKSFNATIKRHYEARGLEEGLVAGVGKVLPSNFYVGAELSGFASQVRTREDFIGTGSTQYLKIEKLNDFLPEMKIGYVLPEKNVLLYGTLGYGFSTWRAKEFNSTSNKPIDQKQALLSGVSYGAGIAVLLNEHLRLDAGFTQTNYNSFSDVVTTGVGLEKEVRYQPSDFSSTLTVSYLF